MLLTELRNCLAQLSIVKNVPPVMRPRLIMIFLGIGEEGKARKGFPLFKEGDPHDETTYVLLSGTVTVDKGDAPSVEVESPHLLGEMVQLNPTRERSATVTATSDVRLLRFAWKTFEHTVEQVFTPDERGALKHALEDYAWSHLTE